MIEFLAELSPDIPYNLHSHTQFCDGRHPMEAFAAEAVEEGFSHYGFSPHSPVPISSTCNMAREDVAPYLDEVRRLREFHAGRTRFYASMEIDYLNEDWGPSNPFFTTMGLDYTIGSVHFIPTQEGEFVDIDGSPQRFAQSLANRFHNDLDYVVRTFFRQSLDMVRLGGLDIIGHLDKVGHNASTVRPGIESTPMFGSLVEELVHAVAARGDIVVEVNTKAFAHAGRFFPSERWWPLLRSCRLPVVVNSDAHFTELISASRAEAIARLRRAALL